MDIDRELDEIQLVDLAKRGHFGDIEARATYNGIIDYHDRQGHDYEVLELRYLAARSYIEALEEYTDGLEQGKKDGKRPSRESDQDGDVSITS